MGALDALERSQSAIELGEYAPESTWLKAHCLSLLDRREEALAHWRLLQDFYPDSQYAAGIDPNVQLEFGRRLTERALAAPEGVEIPRPRYSESANRSRVAGAVVIEYQVGVDGAPSDIRVIETSHPLLASWAIEAISAIKLDPRGSLGPVLPFHAACRFLFVPRYPGGDDAEGEIGKLPVADVDGGETEETRQDSWRFEWFPRAGPSPFSKPQ